MAYTFTNRFLASIGIGPIKCQQKAFLSSVLGAYWGGETNEADGAGGGAAEVVRARKMKKGGEGGETNCEA